ncbi:MAG: peptidylprolyl isomerase [Polyangiaceae bacterium]
MSLPYRFACFSGLVLTLGVSACSDLTKPSDDRVTPLATQEPEPAAPPPAPTPTPTQPPAPPPEPTVAASHILISYKGAQGADAKKITRTKEQAKKLAEDLIKKLPKEDFAGLAKKNSDDPGSGPNGGDLGSFTRGRMVKPFADAAFALQPGEFTKAPVESQFGFHIIKRTK